MARGFIKKLLEETVAYIFIDIPFWTATVLTFLKDGLELLKVKARRMMLKYGGTEAQSWPSRSGKNDNI